ncbi:MULTISPECIES: DUF4357 domain-containing protein [unclassified Streptomyces]|uniref:restriction system modified-DNA reader domain-containing protein n=1 Tax=unclassified Streptomyces TaxID=2593676 RepID=UPI000CD4DFBD|nr:MULTISPECIES: DUF4357 domain-containing protein [unclassified Streptomyces]
MSRTIRVDDDVFAELQSRAEPFVDTPNSTLRKLLGLPPSETSASNPAGASQRDQSLVPLLADGRLGAGQRLVWKRRNLKREHHAVVLSTGELRLDDGSVHSTPSGAATMIAGNQQNGWKAWTTEDGVPLKELR